MANEFLKKDMLAQLVQQHWIEIIDNVRLMRKVLQDVRDTLFKTLTQDELPIRQTKMVITKVSVENEGFELWVEYAIPKDAGIIIGTGIYLLKLNGDLDLKQLFGTNFQPKT